MKCLVLAGGSGDRLWPLSRKSYPKQFMEIREGRSMFQETILRNIPFCDEFVILTNQVYANIVKGQLQSFQGIRYSVICEKKPLKTAPPVIAYALNCEEDEKLLIVSSECLVDGDYAASMAEIKRIVDSDKIGIVVCKPTNNRAGYNFINVRGTKVSCSAKKGRGSLWDCGIMGVKANVLIKELPRKTVSDCATLRISRGRFVHENTVTPVSLAKILKTSNCELVHAAFDWTRITDISSFYSYVDKVIKNNGNTISYNCKNVEIVNTDEQRLIVANGLKNAVIVNTRDAVYVANKAFEADIKGIVRDFGAGRLNYFDEQPLGYWDWGNTESVYRSEAMDIRRINVYPRDEYKFRLGKNQKANFLILGGRALVRGAGRAERYAADRSVVIADCAEYSILNEGREQLKMLCTIKTAEDGAKDDERSADLLVKMAPVYKDNLWGGTKIRDMFHKDAGGSSVIAESWELSAHPQGQSRVASGIYRGLTLSQYIEEIGKDKLGWKAQAYDKFPVMIKFIDARQDLSIQVHPADEYALSVEGEYGKSEMWYIVDAEEDAFIYVGFKRRVTAEEIRRRIADNTLVDILNKVKVGKGEAYFLEAGTVHAIGAGCLICEIQQSSNITYRLYDYGRKDGLGRMRELHIDKALDVINMRAVASQTFESYRPVAEKVNAGTVVGQCKYFSVSKYVVDGSADVPPSDSSFAAFVVVSGSGSISDGRCNYKFQPGDTFFAAAKEQISIKGNAEILSAKV